MKHKRLLLTFSCLASILLAGYITLRLTAPKQHRITPENIEKIQKGMTEAEVEAIFAAPAGVYGKGALTCTYGPIPWVSWNIMGLDLIKKQGGTEWVGEDCGVYLRFDEVGRVNEIIRGNSVIKRGNESFLTKLRRWLGMQ